MQLDENQVSIRCELNGREYFLVCNRESLIGEIHDAICTFKGYVLKMMVDGIPPQSNGDTSQPIQDEKTTENQQEN